MTNLDITGIDTLERLDAELAAQNITLTLAGRQIEFERWLKATGHPDESLRQRVYPTMRQAIRQWHGRDEPGMADEPGAEGDSQGLSDGN